LSLFSSEVLVLEPFVFLGYLFFHWRSLFLSPLGFGVAYFFIGGLSFEPKSEGCNSTPSLVDLA
jgi:hypothetical protein